jgi:hypothetical protein
MKNIHLVIGDAHARPGISNDRFLWLGEYLLNLRLSHPEANLKVIDLGDWEDMESLSSYDVGKKSYEGRRYQADIAAGIEARHFFNIPLDRFNEKQRANHKRTYSVEKYALGGNHSEGRIRKVIESTPMLDGTIGVSDFQLADFGWTYVPFLEPLLLDGITYQHYHISGVMGRPISGESPGLSLIKKTLTSSVCGHSHLLDMAHRTDPHGKSIWGIHAGCFLAKDQYESYAGPANKMWKRGVLVLFDVKDGDFKSFQWKGIEELENEYLRT